MAAWQETLEHERKTQLTAAYVSARLSLADPKKFPKLEDIIGKDERKRPSKKQSDEQISAGFLRFATKHGLKVEE